MALTCCANPGRYDIFPGASRASGDSSWLGHKSLERRASAYLAERAKFEEERRRLMGAGAKEATIPGQA
jgi:hypothetical protein